MDNDLDAFQKRFLALQEEARQYGLVSVVVLGENNPLGDSDEVVYQSSGNYAASLGLVTFAQAQMIRDAQ